MKTVLLFTLVFSTTLFLSIYHYNQNYDSMILSDSFNLRSINGPIKSNFFSNLLSQFKSKDENQKQVPNLKSDSEHSCNFFPPNNLRFPILPYGHMSEMRFNELLQVVSEVYSPIFEQNKLPKLFILRKWHDDTLNAYARECNASTSGLPDCEGMNTTADAGISTPLSLVTMYGGLARHPLITEEGFILVACHEIGHHLGGYPRISVFNTWASIEGQADYFSTSKCARKVFKTIGDNFEWEKRAAVPLEVRISCNNSFPDNAEDAFVCMRSAMGGLSLARVLASINDNPNKIEFKNKDITKVDVTFEWHPQAQCRLDTYVAGSVCRESEFSDFSPVEPRKGACHPSKLNSKGARPLCWFKDK